MLSCRPACALTKPITIALQAPNPHQGGAISLDDCMNLGVTRTFGMPGWLGLHPGCANGTGRTVWRREVLGGPSAWLPPDRMSIKRQVDYGT